VEDEDAVGVAGLSGAGWEIAAVRFSIGRTRRARALGGSGSFLLCKKADLFVLPGKMVPPHIKKKKMVPPSDHMAEIILVFLLAKLISLH